MRRVLAKCIIILSLLFPVFLLSAEEKERTVPKGGNLSTLLRNEDIPSQQISEVTRALSDHYNLRHIYPNQKILIKTENEPDFRLMELRLSADFDEDIVVKFRNRFCRYGEMVDTHVSGACGEIRGGSSPPIDIFCI